ncbi:MAG: hypothetical protein JKY83_13095, partial [Rhizobiaceae bacterium]|nr:hypothetical protein [Rhizobiaceae bacterium]
GHFTTRQNLQYSWPALKDLPAILDELAEVEMHAIQILSPAQRPIQKTLDLPGFWKGSWMDVRSDMRGRYPKHFWPENPAEAAPTSRAKPRKP